MSQQTARIVLGGVFFLFLAALIYVLYTTQLSLTFIIGIIIGTLAAITIIIREAEVPIYNKKHNNKAVRWIILSPLIASIIIGIVRSIGNNDISMLVFGVAGATSIVLLGWAVFFLNRGRTVNPQDSAFSRNPYYKYEKEESEWKSNLRRKEQENAEWHKQRREK